MRQLFGTTTGRETFWWPVLLLFLTALVPSAGVVWMMRAAMTNERLAVRQRLSDAYQVQLESTRRQLMSQWHSQFRQLDEIVRNHLPAEAFARCLASGQVDSVLVVDKAGRIVYPVPPAEDAGNAWQPLDEGSVWMRPPAGVRRTSVGSGCQCVCHDRCTGTRRITCGSRLQAQARCLLQQGDRAAAIDVWQRLCERKSAVDANGRSLAIDAQLRLLQLMEDSPARTQLAADLQQSLNTYDGPLPSGNQRRFAMRQLAVLMPTVGPFPTLVAEDLAAKYVAKRGDAPPSATAMLTVDDGIWSTPSPEFRAIVLLRTATIQQRLGRMLAEQLLPSGVVLHLRSPLDADDEQHDLLATTLGPTLPGWSVGLALANDRFLDDTADDRTALYAWIAAGLIGVTLALAGIIAGLLRRQMRVARLKNDLVATVSHELKTPLASIRLLVDTLLESDTPTPTAPTDNDGEGMLRTREYLELISRENARLTRLIDNFLTFSRMDRGKHRLQFESTDAGQIVRHAADAVRDRFDGQESQLQIAIEAPLPIRGDSDALVTAVVNLLDNAWKYTGNSKQIIVTATRKHGQAIISVKDNGVGLTARNARRVFDRFYQVDQRLSRVHNGCGLGLSIVKQIVVAHGGHASVDTRLGKGSTFTLALPIDCREDNLAQAADATKGSAV